MFLPSFRGLTTLLPPTRCLPSFPPTGAQKPSISEMLWLLPLLWAGSLAQKTELTLTAPTAVTVQEGLCVFAPCTFTIPERSYWTTPPAVYGYWFPEGAKEHRDAVVATNNPAHKVQEGTQGRFHLLGDPQTKNCSLDIRDARRTDDGLYYFRVERENYPMFKYSYTDYMLSVRVTAFNHTPHILIPGNLESGCPRNLTCSVPWACERGTPPIFSWTSAAHSSLGPRTRLSSVLTLTPRPQDHGTNLTCQVHFPAAGVTVERTIQLNVTCPLQNPTPGGYLGDGTAYIDGRLLLILLGLFLWPHLFLGSLNPPTSRWCIQRHRVHFLHSLNSDSLSMFRDEVQTPQLELRAWHGLSPAGVSTRFYHLPESHTISTSSLARAFVTLKLCMCISFYGNTLPSPFLHLQVLIIFFWFS
ncbi:myeloid cell surface antigen CD33-like [Eptesicus fuscus]|uniref:myeloid cell surface antigen CD33-like n=1 Tax=Eptesicus fuscus TaxID=29078 RepID=UPI0024040BC8|nr:myeloid cell surface antigen CD33-like [Eptesicus fuscus]